MQLEKACAQQRRPNTDKNKLKKEKVLYRINSLWDIWFANIFFHPFGCLFILLIVSSFFKNKFIYLFNFWLHWVLVSARRLSLVAASGGFSCCRAWALGTQASVVVACGLSSCGLRALERRLSSCGTRAEFLCGMWDLPGPGLKPMFPALAGGFLTTVPRGSPVNCFFCCTEAFSFDVVLVVDFCFCWLCFWCHI